MFYVLACLSKWKMIFFQIGHFENIKLTLRVWVFFFIFAFTLFSSTCFFSLISTALSGIFLLTVFSFTVSLLTSKSKSSIFSTPCTRNYIWYPSSDYLSSYEIFLSSSSLFSCSSKTWIRTSMNIIMMYFYWVIFLLGLKEAVRLYSIKLAIFVDESKSMIFLFIL